MIYPGFRTILLPPFFLLLPIVLIAQPGILNNSDIVWAVEIEQDWVVDIPCLMDEWDNGIATLKLFHFGQNAVQGPGPFLSDLVFQSILSGDLPVFKDPACSIPADGSQLYPHRDTLLEIDPETYEQKETAVVVEPQPFYDFKAWRLRQVLAYHQKSAGWSTIAEAIAPLVLVKNKAGDSLGVRPLCWFRPENRRPKLTSKHIVWAKKTTNKQTKTQVSISASRPLKISDNFPGLLPHLREVVEKKMEIPLYNSSNDKLLSPNERLSLISRADTFIHCFSPDPEAGSIGIVNYDILDAIHYLQLEQTWYWDERRGRLAICLDAVAPLQDVRNSEGDFRFRKPLFYRRVRP